MVVAVDTVVLILSYVEGESLSVSSQASLKFKARIGDGEGGVSPIIASTSGFPAFTLFIDALGKLNILLDPHFNLLHPSVTVGNFVTSHPSETHFPHTAGDCLKGASNKGGLAWWSIQLVVPALWHRLNKSEAVVEASSSSPLSSHHHSFKTWIKSFLLRH